MCWDSIEKKIVGWLSYMVYVMIYGYDYCFVCVFNFKDWFGIWIKVLVFREVVKLYDIVVFFDVDVGFVYMDLLFEWFMNYWRVIKDMFLVLVKDLDSKMNCDLKGFVFLNMGFIIV